MKTTIPLKQLLTAASIIALTSAPVYAHSDHDHTNLPLKWNFSQDTQSKVEQKLTQQIKSSAIGLSKLDQKILHDYGIHVGNKFKAMIDGKSLLAKRTSLGIIVLDSNNFSNMTNLQEVPIRNLNLVSRVSLNSHSGHDHKKLDKAWTFAPKTAAKISKKINKGNYPAPVGLSVHERNVLDAYGIKVGNTINTQISGQNLSVTRTSGGLIIDQNIPLEIASSKRPQGIM